MARRLAVPIVLLAAIHLFSAGDPAPAPAQADSASAWLGRAFAAGYGDFAAVAADSDFAALRGTAGFDTLVAGARARAYPCESDVRYRAFDFWIGDWNVMMNGVRVGTNTITRELASGKWRQLWVDSGGTQTDYEGVVLPDGTVRQFIRSSPLDREEWTTAFDAIYVPNPKP